MNNAVLCISGRIGSGKSTLSEALSQRLGWSRASFGDYVRSSANQRGLPGTRETLQALGAELVADDIAAFCEGVLQAAGWPKAGSLILDGVRHIEVLRILGRLTSPRPMALVFLDVPDAERRRRLHERSGEASLQGLERHSTEEQADGLRDVANLVISGDEREMIETVLAFIADHFRPINS